MNLAIRPERISFVKSFQDRLNVFEGVVEEVIYLGDTYKYKISIDGKELLIVVEKNDLVTKQHKRGDQVLVGWEPGDMNFV